MMSKLRTIMLTLAAVAFVALATSADMTPIPCAVGNKWEYDTVKLIRAEVLMDGKPVSGFKDTSSGLAVYEVVGADDKSSPVVYDYKESTRTWSTRGGEPSDDSSELKITDSAGALRILSTYSENAGDTEPDKQSYDPPLLYFTAKDAAGGKTWDVGTMRERDVSNQMVGRGAGRETVTVPAGTFKDCLKVVYSGDRITGTIEMWEKQFNIASGKSRGIYWIADGIGVVKELEIATTSAETDGPGGKKVVVQATSCTVSELKPGYVVKK